MKKQEIKIFLSPLRLDIPTYNRFMYRNHHYNKNLRSFARILRTRSVSKAEKHLWKNVLSRKQIGERILRQRPIDKYIIDFFVPSLKLIIEIDGSSHFLNGEKDAIRQRKLESLGYSLIRFTETEVLQDVNSVREKIQYTVHCIKSHLL
jgi:very-short-patch-repair endonuclease